VGTGEVGAWLPTGRTYGHFPEGPGRSGEASCLLSLLTRSVERIIVMIKYVLDVNVEIREV